MNNRNYKTIKKKNLLNMALFYEKRGNYDKFIENCKEAIQKYNSTEAMYRLGCHFHLKKQFGQMLIYLLMAIKNNYTKAMVLLANYSRGKDDIDNFIKYTDMAINLNDTNAMFIRGLYYLKNKNYNNMKKYFLMAIENNNNHIDSMIELALFYKKQKDYNNMKKYLLLSIKNNKNKNDCTALLELADYYEETKNYKFMEKYLLLSAIHGNIDAMLNLANYFYKNKKLFKAINLYKMAIKYKSDEAMYRLGMIYYVPFDKIKNDISLKYLLMCINNNENYTDAYDITGLIYLQNGDLKNAEKYLKLGIKFNNENCYYYYSHILCFEIKKDYEKAYNIAKKAFDEFKDFRHCLVIGNYYFITKKYDDMKKYYHLCLDKFKEKEKEKEKEIDKDSIIFELCSNKLGNYYEFIEKNLEKALEFYIKNKKTKVQNKINNYKIIQNISNLINNNTCCICYDNNLILSLDFCCKQNLCKICINGILNNNKNFKCPFCRFEIDFETNDYNKYDDYDDNIIF
jgi:tetratricopeptide (TPR) repeat protein